MFWLSTVRPGGRPHVTPAAGVWLAGALYFCTGSGSPPMRYRIGSARAVMCQPFVTGVTKIVPPNRLP
jgi:hypothetical protein